MPTSGAGLKALLITTAVNGVPATGHLGDIRVEFALPPDAPVALAVSRSQGKPTPEVSFSVYKAALIEKYGEPASWPAASPGEFIWWLASADRECNMTDACTLPTSQHHCKPALIASIQSDRDKIVSNVSLSMRDVKRQCDNRARAEELKAAAATSAAREREKQAISKPKL